MEGTQSRKSHPEGAPALSNIEFQLGGGTGTEMGTLLA